jgi:hypothetical protein
LLLTRSRSEDEPVAGAVRAAVEAGGGDAGRDADSGRAVARRELGERNSSRLAIPAATTMNLFIGTSLVRPTTRGIIATAKERVNHAECLVAHQTGRGLEPRSSPSRPCPRRDPSSGLQRSPAVNSGHRLRPLTCVTAEQRAARPCFPSSRCSRERSEGEVEYVPAAGVVLAMHKRPGLCRVRHGRLNRRSHVCKASGGRRAAAPSPRA